MIEVVGLTKWLDARVVFDDVSFSASPGHVTGVVTPDSETSSVLVRLMIGLERGRGQTLFDGVPFRSLRRPAHQVGVLLDSRAGRYHHSIRDHLRLMAAAGSVSPSRVDAVLELVGLARVANQPLWRFGPSSRQRLGIAAALLGDPGSLLLHDPAWGLETRGIAWLRKLVMAYAALDRTVLITGTRPEEVALVADRLVVIGPKGRITTDRPIMHSVGNPRHAETVEREVTVVTPQATRLAAVLRGAGARVARVGETSLQVFGIDRMRVGELAFGYGVLIHGLSGADEPRPVPSWEAETQEHLFDSDMLRDAEDETDADVRAEGDDEPGRDEASEAVAAEPEPGAEQAAGSDGEHDTTHLESPADPVEVGSRETAVRLLEQAHSAPAEKVGENA